MLRVMFRFRVRLGLGLGLGFRLGLEINNLYGFHEMLLCETHMCFSEMIHFFWRYVTV